MESEFIAPLGEDLNHRWLVGKAGSRFLVHPLKQNNRLRM